VENKSLYNNCYFTNHYDPGSDDEQVANFVAAYQAKFGEVPNALAALGYDSVYILKQAIEDAGSDDTEAIIEAMQTGTFDVVTGTFTFDENGSPQKSTVVMEYVDGELVFNTLI